MKWSLGLLRIEHPLDCDYIIIFTSYVIWIYLYLALCAIMIIDSSLRNNPYMVKTYEEWDLMNTKTHLLMMRNLCSHRYTDVSTLISNVFHIVAQLKKFVKWIGQHRNCSLKEPFDIHVWLYMQQTTVLRAHMYSCVYWSIICLANRNLPRIILKTRITHITFFFAALDATWFT